MTDRAAEIAAYLGALAWFPQIVAWIWRAASRAALRVRTAQNIQIGHGGLGGVIGLNVAVSAERKDALVDRVHAMVVHERGDRREFVWSWATENQTEMRNDAGERVQMSRTQAVLAIKVATIALAERYIGFQDESEVGGILNGQATARIAYDTWTTAGGADFDVFLRTPEADSVRRDLERAFHWQAGRYALDLVFHVVGGRKHVERFQFNIAAGDVERMRSNLGRWDENLGALLRGGNWPNWEWAYPQLSRR